MNKINKTKDIPWYSWDILWLWFQIRNIYEEMKDKIKNLTPKK